MRSPWPPSPRARGRAAVAPRWISPASGRCPPAWPPPAAPPSRALDSKGRLQLPVDADAATRLPAERDGALVTVFLPGSAEQPRPGLVTVALPLDARGRLTMTAGVRPDAGIPDGADVLAVVDPDRRTVTITAASRLTEGITALLDGLRRPAAAASGDTARSGDEEDIAPVTGADTGPAAIPGGRLRIVG